MSETSEVEAIADEGELTEEMDANTRSEPVTVVDGAPPFTAASTTETIDSGEEAHYCDEWELFSDAKYDASDDEDSADEQGDEREVQLSSACEQATPELAIESVISLTRSEEDDTDRQEEDSVAPELGIECHNAEDSNDVAPGSVAEEDRPTSQGGESADASVRRKIQVVVRVRPQSDSEDKVVVTAGEKQGSSLCVQATTAQGSISTVTECSFDRVFMGAATQEDVFAAVEPSVQACLEGYNATVFAYGQTGTGKTHTLFGRDLGSPRDSNASDEATAPGVANESFRMVKSSWGIVPRSLSYLLDRAATWKEKNCQVELHLSFLQIYNDRLFDLLTDRMRQKPLLIREQPTLEGTTSVSVQGLSSERITSFSHAMQIIHRGHTNRCVRETESNLSSSRSHAIVQLHVTTQCPAPNGDGQVVRRARLNLVDLAGSEKWNTDVEMEDAHSQELKNINTSLSALGNCIAALTEAGRKHIPYRDSTLTRVLQDSFGGNTQSCLIATVNATQQSCDETIRTLHFADRARSVMQTIRVNELADGSTELLMAKIQIVKLRERLESEQRRRHETRLKEHQALQRDFQEKLKGKDKEISKLSRDNAVFQRWREEDVKKIRALESRVKDLEQLVDSNGGKNYDAPKDIGNSTPAQAIKRQASISVSNSTVTRTTTTQKTRSRPSLARAGSDNGTAARTYKQVLERYALASSNEQPQKAAVVSKVAFDPTALTDPSYDDANQLEDPEESDASLSTSEMQRLGATVERCRADESPVAWHQASGVCVSPVTCPLDGNDVAAAQYSSVTNSWVYSNLAAVSKSFSPDWSSSAMSKSTPVLLTQQQDRNGNSIEPWSSNGCGTSASKQDPVALFKSASAASFNYNPLPRAQATSAVEPCLKHKLAGCMLCSVTESFRQTQAVPPRQPAKESAPVTVVSKAAELSRKPQDGPCERHQLLRCFICMKGSVNTTPSGAVQTSSAATSVPTNAPPIYSYSSTATLSTGKLSTYQVASPQADASLQSKCALHSLANCILCAGVKAMTRKVAVPTPQASPAKAVGSFDSRGGNYADDRAADRYRRYTLDERILHHSNVAKTQW